MSTVVDTAHRLQISSAGLDETLFVEAGAGTGKTTQLVSRIVNLVVERGVRLSSIAAITFTEAAASELSSRVWEAFEAQERSATDELVRERSRAAIADADLAAITTLHGFAKRILGEHPVAAGLPPQVDILDDVSSQLAREERWVRFVDELHDDAANEELLVRAALVGAALEPQHPNHATMKDVAAALGQRWDALDAVADAVHPALAPIDLTPYGTAVAALEVAAATCTDPSDGLAVHLAKIRPLMRAVLRHDDPHRRLRALAGARPWGRGRGGRKECWGGTSECVTAVKDLIDDVNEAREAVLAGIAGPVLDRLLTCTSREVRAAAAARQAEGRLEFHDLLVLAHRLLRFAPTARAALHDRYTHLLLDEFQDTDPIQIELAVLIASTVGAEVAPGWDEATVEGGRLFFVGDPKQSIYRFRGADIGLFLRARERFGPHGSWLALITNFRTVPEVVGFVNELFGSLMAQEQPGTQPRYEPLVAHRRSAPGADHRTRLLGGPHESILAGAVRELEAADVAATIDSVRTDPGAWPVDDGDGGFRPARIADVTILIPTRTSLPYLRRALDGRGIPYRLDTGTLVYDTQEVRDALSALSAVDDPTDERSLVAALRSPLYACADTDLLTYRQAGGRWDLRSSPPAGLDPDHPVVDALAHLKTLWGDRWWLSPSALLERLLRERDAHLLAFGDERPREVWRRLRFLVDQAQAFDEARGGGLRDFVAWAELQRGGSARVHEPLLPETDDEGVRILTVHGAKGLEFPITILSGMTTRPGGHRTGVSLLWDGDGSPAVRLTKGLATANHDPRADLEAEMDVHEKLRLLYVACTRARDHLVIACHHKQGDGSYADIVWRFAVEHPGAWQPGPVASSAEPEQLVLDGDRPSPVPGPPAPVDDRVAWLEAREALLAPLARHTTVSATAIAREAGAVPLDDEPRAWEADPEEVRAVPVVHRRGRAGTAIGRAVHATLQLVDLAVPAGVEEQAARQSALESVPEHAEAVAALVRSALASAAVRDAAPRIHHKELYVAAPVGDRVIEGYVDLLVETPTGLVIVDYKTDGVHSAAAVDAKVASYELQGAAYAVALEQATGLAVAGCRFVFCRRGEAIEREVDDLPGAMSRVRAHLAG